MAHLTLAASEETFSDLFEALRDSAAERITGSTGGGAFRLAYDIAFHFEGGRLDLQDDGSVRLRELDVIWDRIDLDIEVDIPEFCVGGFCVLWLPFLGCVARAPEICLFENDPDIRIPLRLAPLVRRSEISGGLRLGTQYFTNPNRQAGWTDHQAHDADETNEWQLVLTPDWLDFDLFDIPDIVGDLLDDAIDAVIRPLYAGLPGWARDVLDWLLDGAVDLVRDILDVGDDIDEWLSNLLGTSVGLVDFVLEKVGEFLGPDHPVHRIEDPYPIMRAEGRQLPVLVPIRNLDVTVDDDEMVVSADIGA